MCFLPAGVLPWVVVAAADEKHKENTRFSGKRCIFAENREELLADWEKAQNGSTLDKIEPLN
jgi:hypothetical protein